MGVETSWYSALGRPLRREPDRGADTSLEDGIGLDAIWGRAGEL
jgi:hypothetical protein